MAKTEEYRREALLEDGGRVTIRAIEPTDRDRLRAAFHRLSAESVALRFMQAKRDLSEGELSYFVEPDFERHVALVATVGADQDEKIVGVGRYIRLDGEGRPGSAELALAVIDDYQGRGLGAYLLEELAGIAVESGIERFEAEVLAANARVLRLFEHCGYGVTPEHVGSGMLHVSLRLPQSKGQKGASGT